MSKREQTLLAIVLFAIVIVAYVFLRVRPVLKSRTDQLTEIESNRSRVVEESRNRPEPPEVSADVWDAEYQKLQEEEAREQIALDELERSFVDSADPGALGRLKRQISDVARSSGVVVLKNVPFDPADRRTDDGARRSNRVADGDLVSVLREWKRPMDHLTVSTSFGGLQGFLRALRGLPSRVVVVSLSIEANSPEESPGEAATPLIAILVLAR